MSQDIYVHGKRYTEFVMNYMYLLAGLQDKLSDITRFDCDQRQGFFADLIHEMANIEQ